MTVTLELDDMVVKKARILAEQRKLSLSEVVSDAIRQIEMEANPAAGFLALMDEIKSKGIGPLPKLTREELNAR